MCETVFLVIFAKKVPFFCDPPPPFNEQAIMQIFAEPWSLRFEYHILFITPPLWVKKYSKKRGERNRVIKTQSGLQKGRELLGGTLYETIFV